MNRGNRPGRWFAVLYWWMPAAVLALSGSILGAGPAMTMLWTGALLVMGSGCLINARRCRRRHCYYTGPFFLAMAVIVALHGSGLLWLGAHGWSLLGNTLIIGGLVLYFLPEWLWGKYRP